jgi:hypothetical protein
VKNERRKEAENASGKGNDSDKKKGEGRKKREKERKRTSKTIEKIKKDKAKRHTEQLIGMSALHLSGVSR